MRVWAVVRSGRRDVEVEVAVAVAVVWAVSGGWVAGRGCRDRRVDGCGGAGPFGFSVLWSEAVASRCCSVGGGWSDCRASSVSPSRSSSSMPSSSSASSSSCSSS